MGRPLGHLFLHLGAIAAATLSADGGVSPSAPAARVPGWSFDNFTTRQDCLSPSPNNTRWVHTALPAGDAPAGGWPVFVTFSVVPWEDQTGLNRTCGPPSHHHRRPVPPGGLGHFRAYGAFQRPLEVMATCFDGAGTFHSANCTFDQLAGGVWVQRYKQALLANGVAVVLLSPLRGDAWDWDATLWAGGPGSAGDREFLAHFFGSLRAGALGPLDPRRVVPHGWSAGAHMVSWLLQLAATHSPAVEGVSLAGGVFFSGGSHLCYRNAGDPVLPALGDCARCNASEACFDQRTMRGAGCSATILSRGGVPCCDMCCPANATEEYYREHPEAYPSHPPVLLAQLTSYDVNADLCAARKYADAMRAHGARAELHLIAPADEHCYCVGTPDSGPAVAGDSYAALCAGVGPGIIPENVTTLSCMGHSMGFAAVVEPLLQFVLSVVGAAA